MSEVDIIQGNCLEVMKNMPDKVFDLVLTDPPYGTTACAWDTVIPFEPMWEQLRRITKENGAIVLFGSQPFTSALVMSNPKMFKYEWIWEKPKGTGHLNAKRMPMNNYENISVFYSEQPTYNPQFIEGKPYKDKAGKNHAAKTSMTDSYGDYTNFRYDNEGKRYPKRLQRFPVVERGSLHPTQKPVALMEYLIKTYTNEGDMVLDFTAGSGTTGVACKKLNRDFIGIELDEKYCDIARKRLAETQVPFL